jgi:hypothetical protein
MPDKEESGSTKLDGWLERIPVLDGGSRRRVTAGTIIILAAFLALPKFQSQVNAAVTKQNVSLSLFVLIGGLLIYATGVLVELFGELFLARAIGNTMWVFQEATRHARERVANANPRHFAQLKYGWWILVVPEGICWLLPYFVMGLFGGSRWEMHFPKALTGEIKTVYETLPGSVRTSIESPLGRDSEFGRRALVDQLHNVSLRRWARRLIDRPRDVLALSSAIVFAILLYLAAVPIPLTVPPALSTKLTADNAQFERLLSALNADPSISRQSVPTLHIVRLVELTRPTILSSASDDDIGSAYNDVRTDCGRGLPASGPALAQSWAAFCQSAREGPMISALGDIEATRYLLVRQIRTQYIARGLALVVGTLFLFVAFFNTLQSTTVSVIKALALERSHAPHRAHKEVTISTAESADAIEVQRVAAASLAHATGEQKAEG